MNLAELVESQLGSGTSYRRRARFEDLCRTIRNYIRSDDAAVESMLGTLYWAILSSPALLSNSGTWIPYSLRGGFSRQLLDTYIESGPDSEYIVVGHGDPVRYSLAILDPQHDDQPFAREIPSRVARSFLEDVLGGYRTRPVEFGRFRRFGEVILARFIDDLLPTRLYARRTSPRLKAELLALLRQALLELAKSQSGGIVLLRRPRLELTNCFSPASVVRTARVTSTAGLMINYPPKGLFITAANHAINGDDGIEIGGVPATVLGRDEVTDSCILHIDASRKCTLFEKASKLRNHEVQRLPPRAHEDASFDGAASGLVYTKIRAHDPSIIFQMPGFASKVYTDNDTLEGDSGAALYDSQEKVVGLAAWRTAYGEDPSYAVWIWARQVLEHHNLWNLTQ